MGLLDTVLQLPAVATSTWRLASKIRWKRPVDPAPGDWHARSAAYLRFGEAALMSSMSLELVTALGAPPRKKGGAWTWPAAFRSNRRFIESSQSAVVALHEIAIVGDRAVFDAAVAVAENMGDLSQAYEPRRGGGGGPQFEEQAALLNEAIVDFAAACRKDLQQKD